MSTIAHISNGTYRTTTFVDRAFPLVHPFRPHVKQSKLARADGFIRVFGSYKPGQKPKAFAINVNQGQFGYASVGPNGNRTEMSPHEVITLAQEKRLNSRPEDLLWTDGHDTDTSNGMPAIPDETDEERTARVERSFEVAEMLVRSVLEGPSRGIIISGPAGVGKTHGIYAALDGLGYTEEHEQIEHKHGKYFWKLSGKVTPIHLYIALYYARRAGHTLLIDDCDSVMEEQDSLNILKAVLDTRDECRVSYKSQSRVFEDEDIPRTFVHRGNVIVITNRTVGKTRSESKGQHLKAIASRCDFYDFGFRSIKDVMVRIRQVVNNGMLDDFDLPAGVGDEIVTLIEDNADKFREVSIRTVIKIARNYKGAEQIGCLGAWKEMALASNSKSHGV